MGEIDQVAQRVHHSDGLDRAVRAGLVAYGLVHLLIGGLALQLAFGEKSPSASSTGAMHALAEQPFGAVLVWLVAAGMFLLVIWRVLEAWQGREHEDGAKKVARQAASLGKAVLYGVVGFSAAKVAYGDTVGSGGGGSSGSGGGDSGSTDDLTAQVMQLPAGPWIVGLVGLAVVGYGMSYVWRGWTEKFLEHLDGKGRTGESGRAYRILGKVGHIAKGVAIAVIGALFVFAAVSHDPAKSAGLDQALQEIAQQPFGQALLVAVALGIACYGAFCFVRARHLSR